MKSIMLDMFLYLILIFLFFWIIIYRPRLLNFSKIFNKKVLGRIYGKKATYSISFVNCKMDWYEIPLLKHFAQKNYPSLDFIFAPQCVDKASDIVLRIFAKNANEDVKRILSAKNEDEGYSENMYERYKMALGIFKIEGGSYEITQADSIIVGESKKVLRITGRTVKELESTQLSQNVFIALPTVLLIFNLIMTDEDDQKNDTAKSDFNKILDSIKFR